MFNILLNACRSLIHIHCLTTITLVSLSTLPNTTSARLRLRIAAHFISYSHTIHFECVDFYLAANKIFHFVISVSCVSLLHSLMFFWYETKIVRAVGFIHTRMHDDFLKESREKYFCVVWISWMWIVDMRTSASLSQI